jgi:hypothetical protein
VALQDLQNFVLLAAWQLSMAHDGSLTDHVWEIVISGLVARDVVSCVAPGVVADVMLLQYFKLLVRQ